MDLSTGVILGVVGLLGLNQLLVRLGALEARAAVFYPLQVLNILAGSAVIWFGIPGLERYRVVSWFIGLMFFLHTVQNTSARSRWLREQKRSRPRSEQAEALREALERAERREREE